MNRSLQEFRKYLAQELTPAKNRGFYVCPLCGSGSRGGASSDGALSIQADGERWHCFSCEQGGDIFDLYQRRDGLTASEAAKAVLQKYGSGRASAAEDFRVSRVPRASGVASENWKKPPEGQKDFTPYLTEAHKALPGSAGESYLMGRGLTRETLERFNLGYDTRHNSVVIPYPGSERGYHVTRAINDKRYFKPRASEAGAEPLFNGGALYAGNPYVFVVEAQLCAISIEQAGGAAVAIGGSGGEKLLAQLRKKPTEAALIVCLDRDTNTAADPDKKERTEAKARKLTDDLNATGTFALMDSSICGEEKDPNDALQRDAAAFAAAIRAAALRVEAVKDTEKAAALAEYRQESASGYIDGFREIIKTSINTPAIPTGFTGLDRKLEGGLYEGLYILGAISSLGKTTFALQILDQIAAAGYDCLVFSLEMARYELMAKSISRLTYQHVTRQGLDKRFAKTTRGITSGSRYGRYSDQETDVIETAIHEYRGKISKRLWIMEGIGDIGVREIREAVAKHLQLTGNRPCILIDYLQILAPCNEKGTDKQNTDKAVLELKRISRDFKIPVIAISSLNRDNYTSPINLAAFKESGAIEYSADVLLGMQYKGMDYQEGEADKAREKRIRELFKANEVAAREGNGVEIEVKILKNRNGGRGTSDPLTFYPMFNTYTENLGGFKEVDVDADSIFKKAKKV